MYIHTHTYKVKLGYSKETISILVLEKHITKRLEDKLRIINCVVIGPLKCPLVRLHFYQILNYFCSFSETNTLQI